MTATTQRPLSESTFRAVLQDVTKPFTVGRFTVKTTGEPMNYAISDAAGNVVAVVRGLWAVLTWCEANENEVSHVN